MCLFVASFIVGGWKSISEGAAGNVGLQASMLVTLVKIILMAVLFGKICDGINALVDAGLEPQMPQYALPREDAKTSGMAIASLVLGICGFCTAGLAAIAGLILGIVGLNAIKKSGGWLKGSGLAIAGIAVSGTALLIIPIMIMMMAITFPAIHRPRTQAKSIVSMSNARQLCLATILYCEDNDGRFPPVDSWPDALADYIANNRILTSPFDPDAGRAWAMNAQLNGRTIHEIRQPNEIILIFECRFGSPPAGGRELLPDEPRGKRGYIIGFLDGHIEYIRPERLDELIWIPGTQPFLEVR